MMKPAPLSSEPPGAVLLFDGECGLCHRVVRTLLRLDGRARLHFAPLQGPTAQAYLRRHGLPTEDFDTLVFVPAWARREAPEFRLRTAGAIGALRAVGGAGRVLGDLLALVPSSLRDLGYRMVGRTRYALFGAWRERPLARAEWAERFLA